MSSESSVTETTGLTVERSEYLRELKARGLAVCYAKGYTGLEAETYAQAFVEGWTEESIKIARRMVAGQSMPLEEISQITQVPLEQVLQMKQ